VVVQSEVTARSFVHFMPTKKKTQDRQVTYDVTLIRVRVTIVDVEKQ
jgi:hypothetical protein